MDGRPVGELTGCGFLVGGGGPLGGGDGIAGRLGTLVFIRKQQRAPHLAWPEAKNWCARITGQVWDAQAGVSKDVWEPQESSWFGGYYCTVAVYCQQDVTCE